MCGGVDLSPTLVLAARSVRKEGGLCVCRVGGYACHALSAPSGK